MPQSGPLPDPLTPQGPAPGTSNFLSPLHSAGGQEVQETTHTQLLPVLLLPLKILFGTCSVGRLAVGDRKKEEEGMSGCVKRLMFHSPAFRSQGQSCRK
ncbi:hypothetical protein NQZ68_024345 [Dissostichus eleginoides]|nr:hypothetical protein NQZ68_024345 [Dissostichus eleginoides]